MRRNHALLGRIVGPVVLAAMVALLCTGCQEYELRPNEHTDTFFQTPMNTVDILLVVDNSCSMIDEQEKLAFNFENFINAFAAVDVDYQIGVVTTDLEQEHHRGHLRCNADVLGTATGPFFIETGVNDVLELDLGGGMLSQTFAPGTYSTEELAFEISATSIFADSVFAVATNDDQLWITTEVPCAEATLEVGGGSLNGTVGFTAGYSMQGVQLITPETPDAAAHFAANVHVGNWGSGFEQGLEGAHMALFDRLDDGANEGFLRIADYAGDSTNAVGLSIVFVSDEEDQSPWSVDDYLLDFLDLKSPYDDWSLNAFRNEAVVSLSAVVGDAPDGCEQTIGEDVYPAQPGLRYIDLAMRTGGIFDSICNEDFSPMVQELGLNISGLRGDFFLSRYPDELTLEVHVDSEVQTEGWIYDCDLNKIVFAPEYLPPSQSQIDVSYSVMPRPTGDSCGGGE